MAINIPAPLVASAGPYTISVQGITRASGGAGTLAGSPTSLTAFVHAVDEEMTEDLENIKPMTYFGANNVPTNFDFNLRITELIQSDIALKLPPLYFTYRYFQIVILAGVDTITYQGSRAGYSRPVVNGASTFMMSLKRIETGATNPTLS